MRKILLVFFLWPLWVFAQLSPQMQMDSVRKETDPVKQYDALLGMVELRNPAFNGFFLEIAEKDFPYTVKRLAYQGLEENSLGENMVIADRILALLQVEKNDLLIESQISLLGKIGSSKHETSLFPYLSNQNVNIRLPTIRSLFLIGTAASVPQARQVLTSETGDSIYSKDIRKFAMLILSKFNQQDSLPVLEDAFKKSLENDATQDESLYAMNAINASSNQKAQELVLNNISNVSDQVLKEELIQSANLPALSLQEVTPPQSEEVPASVPEEIIPEKTPDIVQQVINFKDVMKETSLSFSTPEEGLMRAEKLIQLISYLETEIASGRLSVKDFSKVGDAHYRLARIYDKILDPVSAKENFRKSEEAYAKSVSEWRKK